MTYCQIKYGGEDSPEVQLLAAHLERFQRRTGPGEYKYITEKIAPL